MTRFERRDHEEREQQLADALEVVARRLDGAPLARDEEAALKEWEVDPEFADLVRLLKTARREMTDHSARPTLTTLRRMEETVIMTARRSERPRRPLRMAAGPLPAGTDSELAQSSYPALEDAAIELGSMSRPTPAVDTPSRQLRSDRVVLCVEVDNHTVEPHPMELTLFEAVMGRGEASIRIEGDSQISRRHARLLLLDGNVVINDLDSRNGTFVNGRRITEPEPLAIDDTVEIGNTSLILDEIESESSGFVRATFSSQHGDRYVVDLSEVVFGRASTATVIVDDTSRRLSRRHARLDLCDGQVLITDVGSTNGVVCDGALISGSTIVEPEMAFELGGVTVRILAIMRH